MTALPKNIKSIGGIFAEAQGMVVEDRIKLLQMLDDEPAPTDYQTLARLIKRVMPMSATDRKFLVSLLDDDIKEALAEEQREQRELIDPDAMDGCLIPADGQ